MVHIILRERKLTISLKESFTNCNYVNTTVAKGVPEFGEVYIIMKRLSGDMNYLKAKRVLISNTF